MIGIRYALAVSLMFGLSSAVSLAQAAAPVAGPVVTVPPTGFKEAIVLWPKGAPGQKGTGDGDVPKIFSYPAPGAGPHAAVIVMPGGGYNHLVMGKEGDVEATWLNARGVSAYVLEYRLGPVYRFPAPMLDADRAVRYLRSHAAAMGLKPDQIGVWGFSAGGHLAGYLATIHDAGDALSDDPIERFSDRPDFAILSYARLSMDNSIPRTGNMDDLLGKDPSQAAIDAISMTTKVTKDNSPSFLYSTGGDMSVNPMNATSYYDAMKRAGAPVELHIFERGVHGTGMAQNLTPEFVELKIWPLLLEHWMVQNGWMPAQP
jgi:acetyl esterase/lipase